MGWNSKHKIIFQISGDLNTNLNTEIDKAINSPLGHYENNNEYKEYVDILKVVKELADSNSELKKKYFDLFQKYNNRRLELEKSIESRAQELDNEIHIHAVTAECIRFYYNQKIAIEKAFTQTNNQKESSLRENSVACPNNTVEEVDDDDDDDDESYEYYYYD